MRSWGVIAGTCGMQLPSTAPNISEIYSPTPG
jgi:hypothetical protein